MPPMVQKINRLVESLVQGFKSWPSLEAVQKIPYQSYSDALFEFTSLKIDVILEGEIPVQKQRLKVLPPHEFLETSLAATKDRFFLESIPVHVEYKKTREIETLVAGVRDEPFTLTQGSTYGLFRVFWGVPVVSRTGWIDQQKHILETLPEGFWRWHGANLNARLEHQLADMGTALFHQDPLQFPLSLAQLLETVTEHLLTFHHQFLCPPEQRLRALEALPNLPSGFMGLLNSLIRSDGALDHERKLTVARRLVEQLLSL